MTLSVKNCVLNYCIFLKFPWWWKKSMIHVSLYGRWFLIIPYFTLLTRYYWYNVYWYRIVTKNNFNSLLADLFLYSYETDFIQGLLKKNEKKLTWSFNLSFCYIDDVLSLNNSKFGDFVDRIYPIELEIYLLI